MVPVFQQILREYPRYTKETASGLFNKGLFSWMQYRYPDWVEMDLDIRTLSVVVAIANVLQTLAIAFLYFKNKKYPGIRWWALGSGLTAIGFILFLLRDFSHVALLTIILPNTLIIAGSICIYTGVMHFLERRENRGLVLPVFAFFIISYFYFTYASDDINSRTVIISIVLVFYLLLTARELLWKTPRAIADSSYFIAVILVSEAGFYLFRTLSVLTFAPVENLFTPTIIQTMVFVVYFVGGILLTFGLIFTVNQRLHTEVMDAKDHFEMIFNTNPDGVVISRLDNGIIVDINEGITHLTGFNRDDIIGSSILDNRFWKNPDKIQTVVDEFRKKGYFENTEIVLRRKDGSGIAGITSARMITLESAPHILSVIHDITDRKKSEEALRRSEEKYRNLFMNMTEEVHFWKLVRDADGRIVTWRLVDANPPALKTWDKTREEIQGKTTDEIFGPGATDHYMPVVRKIMAEGIPYRFEDFFPNLDKYFLFTSVPFGDYFITTGSDITGIKKTESELKKNNEDLNAVNEKLVSVQEELRENVKELVKRELALNDALAEKDVLLSEIHHRVKNNLSAFISLLSLEGSIEDTPEGKRLKQDLQNRARSMALIHETLYRTNLYNEVDMGIYLGSLLDQIAKSFTTIRPVKIIVDADGVLLDIPRATPAGLIISEIVTNSFKYAFPDSFDPVAVRGSPPAITVTLSKNEGLYEIIVRDNGIGFPPGFDMTKSHTLGLKLIYFLAKHQMQAKIEVNSSDGTEFLFRFRE
jgi:PAS domain S-box-containing protein